MPHLVVVQSGKLALYTRLSSRPWPAEVTVIWDRRQGQRRRRTTQPPDVDLRHGDRRRTLPATWSALGFLMVPGEDG